MELAFSAHFCVLNSLVLVVEQCHNIDCHLSGKYYFTSYHPLFASFKASTLEWWLCVQYIVTKIMKVLLTAHATQHWEYIRILYECVPLLCISQSHTYKSAVAQSFISVVEADTSWYGSWHCQHEAPPLFPTQKLWLLNGSTHHWTSVLRFDTIVQILTFSPLSPHILGSDLWPSLSDGWIHLKGFNVCRMQFFFSQPTKPISVYRGMFSPQPSLIDFI